MDVQLVSRENVLMSYFHLKNLKCEWDFSVQVVKDF